MLGNILLGKRHHFSLTCVVWNKAKSGSKERSGLRRNLMNPEADEYGLFQYLFETVPISALVFIFESTKYLSPFREGSWF